MANTLEGKKALIIGGTNGIGGAIAQQLVTNKVDVTVTGRHDRHLSNVNYIHYDFDTEAFKPFISDSKEQLPLVDALRECDILCVAYGPFVQKKLEETTLDDWCKLSLADYALPGFLVSSVIPFMTAKKWGRILLFGGTRTDNIHGYRTNAAYAGLKTGISVLTKSVAMEYGKNGITCNAVFPGFTHDAPEGTVNILPEQIASKVVFLLNSSELNGVLLSVDNGWIPC